MVNTVWGSKQGVLAQFPSPHASLVDLCLWKVGHILLDCNILVCISPRHAASHWHRGNLSGDEITPRKR